MNDRAIKRKARELSKREKTLTDDWIAKSLNDEGGRAFLWMLLSWTKVGQQPFTANALITSFNCGELNIGQRLSSLLIEVDPDGYVRMVKEQKNGRRTNDTPGGDDEPDLFGGHDSGREDPAPRDPFGDEEPVD